MHLSYCRSRFFLYLFLTGSVFAIPLTVYASEGVAVVPLENAEDFVNIVNNAYPGLVTPASNQTSAEAGTGAPSGQTQNPEPVVDGITWQEYLTGLDSLNAQVDEGKITEIEWHEKTQALRNQFLAGEKLRGHGFNRNSLTGAKPIDTRAIQIEKNLIDVGNSQVQD